MIDISSGSFSPSAHERSTTQKPLIELLSSIPQDEACSQKESTASSFDAPHSTKGTVGRTALGRRAGE
jgi:hypothetical protein